MDAVAALYYSLEQFFLCLLLSLCELSGFRLVGSLCIKIRAHKKKRQAPINSFLIKPSLIYIYIYLNNNNKYNLYAYVIISFLEPKMLFSVLSISNLCLPHHQRVFHAWTSVLVNCKNHNDGFYLHCPFPPGFFFYFILTFFFLLPIFVSGL